MLGGKYAMIIHRQNRPDLPFASGSGLTTPENNLNEKIVSMLEWGREFVLNNGIRVLAGDVILGEEGEFILVETSTSWPTKQHQGNIVFVHDGESWKSSDYDGTMIFDLKADMISKGNSTR